MNPGGCFRYTLCSRSLTGTEWVEVEVGVEVNLGARLVWVLTIYGFTSSVPVLSGTAGPAVALLQDVRGSYEPCGCSLTVPLGGADRVAHLITKQTNKINAVFVTGETFFDPAYAQVKNEKSLNQFFNLVGVAAMAPSVNDLTSGLASLRPLAAESRFPWVTTNVRLAEGTLGVSSALVEKGKHRFFVTSAILPMGSTPLPAGITLADPFTSILEEVRRHPEADAATLVVLLSGFESRERAKLIETLAPLKRATLLLGAREASYGESVDQWGARGVSAESKERMTGITVVRLPEAKAKAWFQRDVAEGIKANRENAIRRVQAWKATGKSSAVADYDVKRDESYVAMTAEIPTAASATVTKYEFVFWRVGPELDRWIKKSKGKPGKGPASPEIGLVGVESER